MMKRIVQFLLLALMITSSIATAEAKSHKKKSTKTTTEQTLTANRPTPGPHIKPEKKQANPDEGTVVAKPGPTRFGPPVELQLKRGASRRFDLRSLPRTKPIERERVELPEPAHTPVAVEGTVVLPPEPSFPVAPPTANPPAPAPNNVFEGLDRFNWGAGSPPDTNGDAGPTYYIQTVNTSIGIFRKSDGFQEAAFTFNTFMSQGAFGNLCDTNNFGDPVVLYDSFEDRWIITDFAFLTDISGNVLAPAFQCFAASMNGNPLTGGWNFYSIQISDALNDYPKFGIWPDGLYMSSNLFSFGAGSSFQGVRVWAFNKAQMYAGSPTVKVVSFNVGGGDFTLIPSNARLQTGTPPAGRPNLFASTWLFTNALTIYKFHPDWTSLSLSTFTGPDTPIAATSWPNAAVGNAGQPGTATLLDVLQIRAMVQNQYTNFGGTESLWLPHTVRRANISGVAAPRWYQINVTGGTVASPTVQTTTWDPDAANITNRFMPSLAVDRAGNMAMGYSVSSAVNEPLGTSPATNCATCVNTFPSIRYAGRLAGDPVNTFSQTEQTFFTGTASQTGTTRWGDYSAMTLDPDGCTFWYTTEYANPADQTFNHRWLTKFGSFGPFTGCTPVGAGGTITGTVTATTGGAPIPGATINFGARTATTDGSGVYSFPNIPAGTYPSISASKPGFVTASASSIVVTDGGTTTQNFSLASASASACFTDTTQADFLAGVPTNVDLNTSPGDAILTKPDVIDQQNTTVTNSGFGFNSTSWAGQTFIAGATGPVTRADVDLFCSGCTGTTPNITVAIRATTGTPALPTGPDLATATIPGFNSGAGGFFTATFSTPTTITVGTTYAVIFRATANPSAGTYAYVCSCTSPNSNPYVNGQRVTSANSGGTWAADVTSGGRDIGFKIFVNNGYTPSGNLLSSPKDANPATGITPIWSTFSWNGTTPANTSLKFQLAGSNSVNGPFNFVGPDGTAATFFTTSPVTLSPQFYNLRFMEYKALLATTDGTVTPTLNDATTCFNDVDCSSTVATITPTPSPVCGNSTGNTASGPGGMTTYAWGITNGTISSATNIQSITYTAGASGTVTLNLTVTAPNGCIVSSSTPVTINPTPPTPVITPGGPTTFCAGGNVTLTSSAASGNQWYLDGNPIGGETNQATIATLSGSYTVVVTLLGCSSATSAAVVVTVNPNPPTPTITPAGPTTICGTGTVQLSSDAVTGNQWKVGGNPIGGETNQTYTATASGSYTVTVTDVNGCSSTSAPVVVSINPIPPKPTISGTDFFCTGGFTTLTSSSATGNQWYENGFPISGATNQTYDVVEIGDYKVIVTINGCASPESDTLHVSNPTPHKPVVTPGGPTTFCAGGSVTLSSNSATGIKWYLNGNLIVGANSQNYVATASGSYTCQLNNTGCLSEFSDPIVVTVNPLPPTPTITPGGPTTFCAGGSVLLSSSAGSGNQWKLNGSPIGGATATTYSATASGNYTVTVTDGNGCSSTSATTTVTVNPIPATPTISPSGPTTFCAGGSVTLTSSSATGNQWKVNGNPIGGATNQTYLASVAGDYTVIVTQSGCSSATSAVTTVTVNPNPNATITAPASVNSGTTNNPASVANAGVGATYAWSATNGSITSGNNTPNVTFSAGAAGTMSLQVTVTTAAGCVDTKSANINVTTSPVSITSVVPPAGKTTGGKPVTINGTGFLSGATVTFGGSPATGVVVVNSTKITATTPAHAAGFVNVTVTNTNTTNGTLVNGYKYVSQQFDANNDNVIDPADIFYLVNYLFLSGNPPMGPSGMLSGDANGDNAVDPSDIFYVINYLFMNGPAPASEPSRNVSGEFVAQPISGSVTLGQPFQRDGRTVIPVSVSSTPGAEVPQALSLRVVFSRGPVGEVSIHRAGDARDMQPGFEISRRTANSLVYLLSFEASKGRLAGVVAEIELDARPNARLTVDVDPALTLLSNQGGTRSATVASGTLRVTGTSIGSQQPLQPKKNLE